MSGAGAELALRLPHLIRARTANWRPAPPCCWSVLNTVSAVRMLPMEMRRYPHKPYPAGCVPKYWSVVYDSGPHTVSVTIHEPFGD